MCRSRNFWRYLEINITARFRILKKNFVSLVILWYLMTYPLYNTMHFWFSKVYVSCKWCVKMLIFLFKKWHKFLSSWRRYSKFSQNSRANLVILTNFLAGKLLRHIDPGPTRGGFRGYIVPGPGGPGRVQVAALSFGPNLSEEPKLSEDFFFSSLLNFGPK